MFLFFLKCDLFKGYERCDFFISCLVFGGCSLHKPNRVNPLMLSLNVDYNIVIMLSYKG